eukprot:GGOE01058107.1.p3 GENE.GGOE01058107.1~~GGOE01058107.1.p3  ORF type:complete len:131 (-),score=3.35 GGOE01058107.1:31-423(-)
MSFCDLGVSLIAACQCRARGWPLVMGGAAIPLHDHDPCVRLCAHSFAWRPPASGTLLAFGSGNHPPCLLFRWRRWLTVCVPRTYAIREGQHPPPFVAVVDWRWKTSHNLTADCLRNVVTGFQCLPLLARQ